MSTTGASHWPAPAKGRGTGPIPAQNAVRNRTQNRARSMTWTPATSHLGFRCVIRGASPVIS
jgi:hypothetical protein